MFFTSNLRIAFKLNGIKFNIRFAIIRFIRILRIFADPQFLHHASQIVGQPLDLFDEISHVVFGEGGILQNESKEVG